jgi:alpha-tubulin suppressor-like RCC1 family protein
VTVSGLTGATDVTVSRSFSCALAQGSVYCWGANGYGQLGNGSTADSSLPVPVQNLSGAVSAIIVGGHHACAIVASGAVECWGDNAHGQLGTGDSQPSKAAIGVVGLAGRATAIAAGDAYTCAVIGADVYCWGQNNYGQLGDSSQQDLPSPTRVQGLSAAATSICAGVSHTCAIVTGGLECWGTDISRTRNGDAFDSFTAMRMLDLDFGVTNVAAGLDHTCVLLGEKLECWGPGVPAGQAWASLATPIRAVATGEYHDCALATDDTVLCWGANGYGQLGDGTTADSPLPVRVSGLLANE